MKYETYGILWVNLASFSSERWAIDSYGNIRTVKARTLDEANSKACKALKHTGVYVRAEKLSQASHIFSGSLFGGSK